MVATPPPETIIESVRLGAFPPQEPRPVALVDA